MPYNIPMSDDFYRFTPFSWPGHVSDSVQNVKGQEEQQKTVPSYCNMQGK